MLPLQILKPALANLDLLIDQLSCFFSFFPKKKIEFGKESKADITAAHDRGVHPAFKGLLSPGSKLIYLPIWVSTLAADRN